MSKLSEMKASVWTRAKWVELRSKKENGAVPSGACAKVKMGEALDRFHGTAAKGHPEMIKAGETLLSAVKTYKEAIKTKYPRLHQLMEKDLQKVVEGHIAVSGHMTKYAATYTAMLKEVARLIAAVMAEAKKGDAAVADGAGAQSLKELGKFVEGMSNPILALSGEHPKLQGVPVNRLMDCRSRLSKGWDKPAFAELVQIVSNLPLAL